MDVASLCTNTDIEAGTAAVKRTFERNPDPKRLDEEVLQLLDINLKRNDFMFDGKFYLHVKGTAMGKRFAPAYANIFVSVGGGSVIGMFEETLTLTLTPNPKHYLIWP